MNQSTVNRIGHRILVATVTVVWTAILATGILIYWASATVRG